MFKDIKVHANFNERTGYGVHASRFFPKLEALVSKNRGSGEVHISLLDVVTASQTTVRHPFPSILFTVWESTEYPQDFLNKLQLYDQLWVPSEWQRSCSIAQGIPEEFVKVVPEGVDPVVYKPLEEGLNLASDLTPFKFVHVGQWQPRKSTIEIIKAFLQAFPYANDPLQTKILELSVDTLFPSDNYKTTEERLAANGIDDPRIRVIHFEERDAYIRRLQSAHCFVSCSRGEGWGLPIIEAICCGIPTIVADWGGSTEYATDNIRIPIDKLIKPFGIYGNWDVPGQWCEPDWNKLIFAMREVFERYEIAKANAVKTADRIRDKFSWDCAAKKAFDVLEQLHKDCQNLPQSVAKEISKEVTNSSILNSSVPNSSISEDDIRAYAKKHGFEITGMKKIPSVFVIGTWPNSQEKLDTLIETINQVKVFGYPVAITTHYPLPAPIFDMVDYVIYEKKNVLSGDWTPSYTRIDEKGIADIKKSRIQYHGVACLNNIRNAADFLHADFSRMYYLEYDCEVEIEKFMEQISGKPFSGIDYEGGTGIRTDVWCADISFITEHFPKIHSWEEYVADMKDVTKEYPLERWLLKRLPTNQIDLVKMDVGNRYDQVDRTLWENDLFIFNNLDGPQLLINGISNKEYEVKYNAGDKNLFTVMQKAGMWSRANKKYYLPWDVTATLNGKEVYHHTVDPRGKRILISFGSKALGDTIAWMPYVEEFRKKHECHVICSGWWQEIFDYPEIEFVKPGAEVKDIYAVYTVGCFDDQMDKNVKNWRETPLQKVAADILGLDYVPMRAKLKVPEVNTNTKPYVCFSEFSTMRSKLWNRPDAWQKVIDSLNERKLSPICVSTEKSSLTGIVNHCGQSIQATIADIAGCEFYVGLNHGPAWIAYALGKPTIMITGVSEEWNDFECHRVALNHDVCGIGCFNDPLLKIDRGWEWCPRGKDYACTSQITEKMVIDMTKLVEKEVRANASSINSGEKSDGHSRISPRKAVRKKRGNGEDVTQPIARFCDDAREGVAGAQE